MIGMSHVAMISSRPEKRKEKKKKKIQHSQKKSINNLYEIEFKSVLRIRPLKSKEKEDHVLFEKSSMKLNYGEMAVLHPNVHMPSPSIASPNFIQDQRTFDFHFDKILDVTATQENVFYALGLSMASTSMEPLTKKSGARIKSSILISMGSSVSGKSYSTFGKGRGNSHAEEGLVPRIMESIFSQSKHHVVSSNSYFGVRITLLLVENERVKDLLIEPKKTSTTPQKKMSKSVMAMVANLEKGETAGDTISEEDFVRIDHDEVTEDHVVRSSSQVCKTAAEAREILSAGLSRGHVSRMAGFGKSTARGHIIITLQPLLMEGRNVTRFGGTVAVFDLATTDTGSKKAKSRAKDSISSSSALSAVMHCFRAIKHNKRLAEGKLSAMDLMANDDASDISNVSESHGKNIPQTKSVPWRQSKVTMLLQPLFSSTAPWYGDVSRRHSSGGGDGKSQVTILMAAYPGHRDYTEKKSVLTDLELLHGQDIGRKSIKRAQTGLDLSENSPGKEYDDLVFSSSDISPSSKSDGNSGSSRRSYGQASTCGYESADEPRTSHGSGRKDRAESDRYSYGTARLSVEDAASSLILVDDYRQISEHPPRPSAPMLVNDLPGVVLPSVDNYPSSPACSAPPSPAPPSPEQENVRPSKPHPMNPNYKPPFVDDDDDADDADDDGSPTKRPYAVDRGNAIEVERVERDYTASPPRRRADFKTRSGHSSERSPLMATVSSSPNIQPPKGGISSLGKSSSAKSSWIKSSPIKSIAGAGKTLSSAVKAGKNGGKKAMAKMEKLSSHVTNRVVSSREPAESPMVFNNGIVEKGYSDLKHQDSSSFSASESPSGLLKTIKELEKRNAKLLKRNSQLEDRCSKLEEDKELLERLLEQARRGRRSTWTQDDEEEWRKSKRLRLKEQCLIKSPLTEHLEAVEATYNINNKWHDTGKTHFSLLFPHTWNRASALDQRDKELGLPGPNTITTTGVESMEQQHRSRRPPLTGRKKTRGSLKSRALCLA